MSVFEKFKKALGFSDDENDDFYNEEESAAVVKIEQKGKDTSKHDDSIVDTAQLTPLIFDGVIKLFNDSFPDFIKNSLDIEAQRRNIYDSLDEGLKAAIEKSIADARSTAGVQWKNERESFRKEIEDLKLQNKTVGDKHSELRQQQLSAERQKRAMKERLTDLENQISAFEAEKEQYELEIKSLLNKLKVSSVIDGDTAELKQEIVSLQEQLEEARKSDKATEMQQLIDSANEQLNRKNEQIAALETQLADATPSEETVSEIEGLKLTNKQLTEQNSMLDDAVKQLKKKEEIADVMINDLNKKAAEATEKLKSAETEIAEKDEYIKSLSCDKNSSADEIESLRNMLKLSNEELLAVREELSSSKEEIENAREAIEALDEIQNQVAKFEEIKTKKDSQITELKKESKKYSAQLKDLEQENESLKKTIEKNLYAQVESEKLLKDEIEQLKSRLADKPVGAVVDLDSDETVCEIGASVKRSPKISAIDESLDDTDWLVSTPPPGTVTRPVPSTTDDDFGYKSPIIKNAPENEAQMSLFE